MSSDDFGIGSGSGSPPTTPTGSSPGVVPIRDNIHQINDDLDF